ncbi:hypothetical protein C5F49_03545 [Nitrosopumilus oxyclinae]|uniref:Uncharacterized protein n=1 Tax=Nitrosopumilus oxyclinae TaxID=1959104 RepID=A0A7D5M157_9ARCH|nr:hypothetical protein [Nitrosopumilus oxyclinae]QLH04493.1 hypothetical protein C5F49_03545 [Nitrosopumilus oxyclinae]
MNKNREMKRFAVTVFSVLLLSMTYSGNFEIFASTVQQEKQDIINQLENIKNDDNISKKSKKNLELAIKKLEKSLNSEYWKDESTINFKHGKKVLNADQQAIKKLENILKDKKLSNEIKDEIKNININITQLDKSLVENAINELEEIIMSDKGVKKIEKAIEKIDKGNVLLEDEKYSQALKNYVKAWDQIKKALKDPNFKKLKLIHLEGSADLDYDGDNDIYLKILKPKKPNKPYEVDIKMTSECLKGNTVDTAGLKIGFSAPVKHSTESFHEEFDMTNEWFKKYDPDGQINTVVIDSVSTYSQFPETGDNFIQTNSETMENSFDLIPSSPMLDEQESWEGKFQFTGQSGDYHIVIFTPTIPAGEPIICNALASFTIDTTFE